MVKFGNRLAAMRAAAYAEHSSMRSVKRYRLTRWTPAVAGVAMSIAAACSGGADASSSGDLLGGFEGSPENAEPGGFNSQFDSKSYPGERTGRLPYGEAWDDPGRPLSAESDGNTSVAYVDVAHTRTPGIEFSQAMAHVARGASPARVTVTARLVGLSVEIPNPGRCIAPATQPRPALTGLSALSLLDAGAITVQARPVDSSRVSEAAPDADDPEFIEESALKEDAEFVEDVTLQPEATVDDGVDGEQHQFVPEFREPVILSLAPRAFPGVSSLASGVVYTSRDRLTRLPDAAMYQVDVAGGREVGPLTLTGEAPAYLRNVTLSGLPIAQVHELDREAPIDVTWDVGAAEDIVFVEVIDRFDGNVALRCSFADAAGSGTVPWAEEIVATDMPTEARVSVHRYRRVVTEPTEPMQSRGELRFDFELSQDVRFD